LWRRAAWGFTLAAVVLVAGVLQQVEYMTALVFQARAAIPGATGFDPFEPVIIALYLTGAVVLLASVQKSAVDPSAAEHILASSL
jgi:hypothetical protein